MSEYTPNSHKYREEQKQAAKEKKIEKVVSNPVTIKKKSEIRKFADVFISEDMDAVKSHAVNEVLVPTIKKAIVDIVTDGINMIFFGSTGRDKKRGSSGYVSYNSYSSGTKADRFASESNTSTGIDLDSIVFKYRGEAEAALSQLRDVIEEFGFTTIADLYDMVDRTAPHTANRYGWTNLNNADVVRVRDGYVIKLPKARVID